MTYFNEYADKIADALRMLPVRQIDELAHCLRSAWKEKRQVFLCGNGGSAANALHIANDFFYGVAKNSRFPGIKTIALPANQAVVSCLANDVSYAAVYAEQLRVYGLPGDVLIVLSGSGNSANILQALEAARLLGISSYAILGYTGGRALELADTSLHIPVHDMQISEDIQVIIGHMLMQWLVAHPPEEQ